MTASTGVSRPRAWLAALFSLVLVASMTMGLPAFATADDGGTGEDHCPGGNEGNAPPSGEYEDVQKFEGEHNTVVPDAGTYICVKAGSYATGIIVADGTTSLRAYVEAAGIRVGNDNVPDVSYYVVYSLMEPSVPGAVTVVKAWDLDGAFEGMTEADVHADLEVRIDGEAAGAFPSGHTFTDLEMGTLVEIVGESNVEVPEGCTFDNDLAGAAWTVTDTAPVGTITVTNEVTCVLDDVVEPAAVTVEFAKAWAGDDDLDGVTAWLTVEGEEVAFGEVVDVSELQGETLSVTEQVEGLPEGCTWESDLDRLDLTVPVADEDDLHYEITVTNEVACVLDDVIVAPGDLTITKEAIDGATLDDDGNRIVQLDEDGEVEVTYRFVVANGGEGAVELETLEDTTFGDLFEELGTATLAAGASVALEVTATLTADDFDDEGRHHNVVTVTGVDEEGAEVSAEADEVVWLVEVEDAVVERPEVGDRDAAGVDARVDGDVERVAVAGVTAVAVRVLPRTGSSLLGLLAAGLLALGAGAAMTATARRRELDDPTS